jgi:hypothetical protein
MLSQRNKLHYLLLTEHKERNPPDKAVHTTGKPDGKTTGNTTGNTTGKPDGFHTSDFYRPSCPP